MRNFGALQTMLAWAEDRALLRSTPSADPGAKTGAGAEHCSAPGSHAAHNRSGIGTEATNLRGTMPRHPGQDVVHHQLRQPAEIPFHGEPRQSYFCQSTQACRNEATQVIGRSNARRG